MGAFMMENGWVPDKTLCSTARRAVETWALVSRQLDRSVPTETTRDLYHASPASVLNLLRDLHDEAESVLLVGHNPTFEDLALALAATGDPEALGDLRRKYPTGALAVIDLPLEVWADLRGGEGSLRAFVKPRALVR
jgi:phosphohistidine phosphatase